MKWALIIHVESLYEVGENVHIVSTGMGGKEYFYKGRVEKVFPKKNGIRKYLVNVNGLKVTFEESQIMTTQAFMDRYENYMIE